MSRWKSPQAGAKQAERAGKEAEELRRAKRKEKFLLVGIILLMLTTWAAYLLFYGIPRMKKPHRHHQHRHQTRTSDTNHPVQPSGPR